MKISITVIWLLRVLAAVIMLQTLYFKFTAQQESVDLFTTLGMEPWGRIGTGVFELIASLLLLFPKTTGLGAALGAGLMAGALFFHFTILGLKFGGDYVLFSYAVIAFTCCVVLLLGHRHQLLFIFRKRQLS